MSFERSGQSAYPNQLDYAGVNPLIFQGVFVLELSKIMPLDQKRSNWSGVLLGACFLLPRKLMMR